LPDTVTSTGSICSSSHKVPTLLGVNAITMKGYCKYILGVQGDSQVHQTQPHPVRIQLQSHQHQHLLACHKKGSSVLSFIACSCQKQNSQKLAHFHVKPMKTMKQFHAKTMKTHPSFIAHFLSETKLAKTCTLCRAQKP